MKYVSGSGHTKRALQIANKEKASTVDNVHESAQLIDEHEPFSSANLLMAQKSHLSAFATRHLGKAGRLLLLKQHELAVQHGG
ncbi:hypothetical protein [Mesorhizobium sp. M0643]|uniref:hypothetical protein n=1 Tax=Mesorhizobium sp. M0643 TaxID=2956978 RepID=UPI00333DAE56